MKPEQPATSDWKQGIRLRVRDIAEQQQMTISNLAVRSGLSSQIIHDLWYWDTSPYDTSLSTLNTLAYVLHVPVTALIDASGETLDNMAISPVKS